MLNKKRNVFLILLAFGLIWVIILLMQVAEIYYGKTRIDMLFPKGIIALKERNLLFILQGLMLIVVLPVFALFFIFIWKYRVSNRKAIYRPDNDTNHVVECIWWGVPLVITLIIAIISWEKTHELDPFKPINSEKKPITIQVVALQWKWLFIYPEEKIASVNFVQFPEKTPVYFEITSDAPMNSFWIPRLGGQIYAMPKMRTKLHLIADEAGDYDGASANISGIGFAGMHFVARASSQEEFEKWIQSAKQSQNNLSLEEYQRLVKPSQNNPIETFILSKEGLFDWIIMKYMMPMSQMEHQSSDQNPQVHNEAADHKKEM